ncbi:hypothetical protein ANCCAN_06745 [Ancylostoma caninum]|uniref:Saposin B-type domain-containing protein n=1 Tax=Ancylostoma caninum TaxID=29170 RepID=A0A368GU99_ANCCA|nr:hypothetical protein ANCCAN_06745 [Ancylostoma caninum]
MILAVRLSLLLAVASAWSWGTPRKSTTDQSSILHRLCTPCKWLFGMVKSLNEKSELMKVAARITCSVVTFNPPFCDAAVKVASIGLDYSTPEMICSTIHLCAPPEHHGWFFMAKPSPSGLEAKTLNTTEKLFVLGSHDDDE